MWFAATLGALAGALLLYAVGAWLGYDRLHRLAGRRWFVLSSRRDLERGRELFDRHGGAVVLVGRCIPLVRSLVSIPAGVAGMPVIRFALLTTLGTGVWNALFVGMGWFLGERWGLVEQYMGPVGVAAGVLVALAVALLVLRRLRSPDPLDAPHT